MRCQRDLRELKKADALTLISQMETRPQHRRLVAGTRPATTLSPVAYITTDFIGCAKKGAYGSPFCLEVQKSLLPLSQPPGLLHRLHGGINLLEFLLSGFAHILAK